MSSNVLPHLTNLHIGIDEGMDDRVRRLEEEGKDVNAETLAENGVRWLIRHAKQLETLSVNSVNITPRFLVTILRLDESQGYRIRSLHITNTKQLISDYYWLHPGLARVRYEKIKTMILELSQIDVVTLQGILSLFSLDTLELLNNAWLFNAEAADVLDAELEDEGGDVDRAELLWADLPEKHIPNVIIEGSCIGLSALVRKVSPSSLAIHSNVIEILTRNEENEEERTTREDIAIQSIRNTLEVIQQQSLTALFIQHTEYNRKDVMKLIAKQGPSLERLKLNECNLSDMKLLAPDTLPKLNHLTLKNCDNLTTRDVLRIAIATPNLKSIFISRPKVKPPTVAEINELEQRCMNEWLDAVFYMCGMSVDQRKRLNQQQGERKEASNKPTLLLSLANAPLLPRLLRLALVLLCPSLMTFKGSLFDNGLSTDDLRVADSIPTSVSIAFRSYLYLDLQQSQSQKKPDVQVTLTDVEQIVLAQFYRGARLQSLGPIPLPRFASATSLEQLAIKGATFLVPQSTDPTRQDKVLDEESQSPFVAVANQITSGKKA